MKDNVNIITLEEPTPAKKGSKVYKEGFKAMGQMTGMLIGAVFFLLGFIVLITLFWTIIGAFMGIGAMFVGFVMIWSVLPKIKAECPACDTSQKIVSGSKSFKCSTCKQTVVVKWIKQDKQNQNLGGI